MELCSMLCASLHGKRVWRKMNTCTCMTASLHCLPETTTTLLTGYTPIQNKKFKNQNKVERESDFAYYSLIPSPIPPLFFLTSLPLGTLR